jgi:SAM-dependent methyltransferase
LLACCSDLYANPLAELLVGGSFHPGGLASTRHLLRASGLGPAARVLDAGCGLGGSARLAADEFGLTVDAVDGSAKTLALAEARSSPGRIRWHLADLARLPLEAQTFDAALAECVLSATDRAAVLRELARVVAPGAVLAMSDVEVEGDGEAVPALARHRLLGAALCVTDAWRPGELETALPLAGFRLVRRWDLTSSILALVDRMEARLGFATIAARDLGLDLATLADGATGSGRLTLDTSQVDELSEAVRAAVRGGRLRYFGSIAVRSFSL